MTIVGNTYYNNGINIDLNNDGVTPNATCTTNNTTANHKQCSPVFTKVQTDSRYIHLDGMLVSHPNEDYLIEVYGVRNGLHLETVGTFTVTTNSSGLAEFEKVAFFRDGFDETTIRATAIRSLTGDTSELSPALISTEVKSSSKVDAPKKHK